MSVKAKACNISSSMVRHASSLNSSLAKKGGKKQMDEDKGWVDAFAFSI